MKNIRVVDQRTMGRLTLVAACFLGGASLVGAQTVEWIRQYGTPEEDVTTSISFNQAGILYLSGWQGKRSTSSSPEQWADGFLKAYSRDGVEIGHTDLSTEAIDEAWMTLPTSAGGVLVVGSTAGDLAGANQGPSDVFVSAFESNGAVSWSTQLGTAEADTLYLQPATTTVSGTTYIAGGTRGSFDGANAGGRDAFLLSLSPSGDVNWINQFGTERFDRLVSVATDLADNAFAVGDTNGSIAADNAGGSDVLLQKYDSLGQLQWERQFGTAETDQGLLVEVDHQGSVFVVTQTLGDIAALNAGEDDIAISKFDSSGELLWCKQFGTSGGDLPFGSALDAFGNLFIVGRTNGSLDAVNVPTAEGEPTGEMFVRKYSSDGELLWGYQHGSTSGDIAVDVAVGPMGALYITGTTFGSLAGATAGDWDFVLLKLIDQTSAAGDYTGDGVVDAQDYAAWRGSYGRTGNLVPADGNGDGRVGAADYTVWRDNMARGTPVPVESIYPAPEPASMLVIAGVGVCFSGGRCRTHRSYCGW